MKFIKRLLKKWKYRHFKSDFEYGDFIAVEMVNPTEEELSSFLSDVHIQIDQVIPPEYRFKIELMHIKPKESSNDPLGQRGYIAWRYRHGLKAKTFLNNNTGKISDKV